MLNNNGSKIEPSEMPDRKKYLEKLFMLFIAHNI